MNQGWIYGAPPAPPAQNTTNSKNTGRGKGSGRGRGQGRNNVQRFQPAMQLDASMHSVQPQTIQAPPVASQIVANQLPTQYNAGGYAISSTYNSAVHPNLHVESKTVHVPAPKIQGTNISLDTPEDIAAWIAERKKKWPTAANVEKNKIAQASRPARPPNKKRKADQQERRHVKAQKASAESAASANSTVSGMQQEVVQQVPASSLDVALAALSGPIGEQEADLDATNHDVQTVEASMIDVDNAGLAVTEPAQSFSSVVDGVNAETVAVESDSGSLTVSSDETSSSSDDSSDDDDDEDVGPAEESSKSVVPPLATEAISEPVTDPTGKPVAKRPCKYFRQGRCHHGDKCTFLHVEAASRPSNSTNRQNRQHDDRNKLRKRKSLYERLVETEIVQEKEAERLRLEAESQAEPKQIKT